MYQYTISLLALLLIVGCGTTPTPLSEYPEVAVFPADVQEDLSIIVDFMDQSVCQYQELENSDVTTCYKAFFQSLAEATTAAEILIPFSNADRAALFGKLKPQTVQSIWLESQSPDSGASVLAVSHSMKYGEFLEKYAAVNPTAGTYYELLRSTGYVASTSFIDRLTSADDESVPLSDERMRLLIAVQFLAMSTQ